MVLLLEGGQSGEDETERGHHHEQARHDRHHLEIDGMQGVDSVYILIDSV